MRQWWPVAFLFALLVLVLGFVFFVAVPRSQPGSAQTAGSGTATGGAGSPGANETEGEIGAAEKAQRFAEAIEQRQPVYTTTKWNCPVDQVELDVPQQASRNANNRFGGVATDLMAIALGPPPAEGGRPSLDKQDWEMLLVTCPQCGATFHGIDLWQLQNGNYKIEHWNLKELVPVLAEKDFSTWTVEERILVRILTQRAAGVEDVELAFSAIQGAYAANFNTWYGTEVHIPSDAFYALAAAYFRRALESGEGLNTQARSIASQTMGEAYRLLGRSKDAQAAFAAALEVEINAVAESPANYASWEADWDGDGQVDENGTDEPILKVPYQAPGQYHPAFTFYTDSGDEISTVTLDVAVNMDQFQFQVLTQLEGLLANHRFSLEIAQIEQMDEPPGGWYLSEMLPAINGHIAEHRDDWNSLDDPEAIIAAIVELLLR
jgi:hypothetical protein